VCVCVCACVCVCVCVYVCVCVCACVCVHVCKIQLVDKLEEESVAMKAKHEMFYMNIYIKIAHIPSYT